MRTQEHKYRSTPETVGSSAHERGGHILTLFQTLLSPGHCLGQGLLAVGWGALTQREKPLAQCGHWNTVGTKLGS